MEVPGLIFDGPSITQRLFVGFLRMARGHVGGTVQNVHVSSVAGATRSICRSDQPKCMSESPIIRSAESFRYVEMGEPNDTPSVLLLHGMLGDVDNWMPTARRIADNGYHAIVPILPVYDLPLRQTSVPGLVEYVLRFTEAIKQDEFVVGGNSLGGHVALLFALAHPQRVAALILSGSSGIYELEMGTSTPRRRDRDFIRERAALTFYDPVHATDQMVDEMYDLLGDRPRVVRLIKMARSAKNETVTDRLNQIKQPTLLVWGRDDKITPPDVALLFQEEMPHARLHFLDSCGHAPMIERPDVFNQVVLDFLGETVGAGHKNAF